MTKWILILVGVYAGAVLNSVVAPLVGVRGVTPDFLALVAVLATLCARDSAGLLAAGLAGVLADVNVPGRLGVGMAVFALTSVALSRARHFTQHRPLFQALATWLAVSVTLTAAAFARSIVGESAWSLPDFVSGGLAAGLYTALLSLPCFWLFERFDRLRAVAY